MFLSSRLFNVSKPKVSLWPFGRIGISLKKIQWFRFVINTKIITFSCTAICSALELLNPSDSCTLSPLGNKSLFICRSGPGCGSITNCEHGMTTLMTFLLCHPLLVSWSVLGFEGHLKEFGLQVFSASLASIQPRSAVSGSYKYSILSLLVSIFQDPNLPWTSK